MRENHFSYGQILRELSRNGCYVNKSSVVRFYKKYLETKTITHGRLEQHLAAHYIYIYKEGCESGRSHPVFSLT